MKKLCSIHIYGFKEKQLGIIIEEGKDWIFIKSLFADYMLDGYKLINKQYIINR